MGWASLIFAPYMKSKELDCPSTKGRFANTVQVNQTTPDGDTTNLWMWRFDQTTNPVPLDNFWGKSIDQAVLDLASANNPVTGVPQGPSEVELAVDPYFPSTIPSVEEGLKGKTSHAGGRNRLHLDTSAKFVPDHRTLR